MNHAVNFQSLFPKITPDWTDTSGWCEPHSIAVLNESPLFINNPEWMPQYIHTKKCIYCLIRLSVSQTQSTMEALWSRTENQMVQYVNIWSQFFLYGISRLIYPCYLTDVSKTCPENSQLSVTVLDKIHPIEANPKTEPWEMLFCCYMFQLAVISLAEDRACG